jgi:hypothetical protein
MGKKETVLKLRSEGKKYREIAELLNCNLASVYYYLKHDKNLEHFKSKRKDQGYKNARINYVNKSKTRNRQIVLDHFETHPCVDCGNTDVRVLEFDHVRGTKIDCVSVGVKDSWSVEKLVEEINKCEVRCANCHKIMTDTRRKHKIINQ